MSYEQTRSTQDPPAYALLPSTMVPLVGSTTPLYSSLVVGDTAPGLPPVFEVRVYSNVITYPGSFTINYTPPTANERCILQWANTTFGFSGSVSGLRGAFQNLYVISNNAGTPAIAATATLSGIVTTIPGYGPAPGISGGSVTLTIAGGPTDGQAKMTTVLRIIRSAI